MSLPHAGAGRRRRSARSRPPPLLDHGDGHLVACHFAEGPSGRLNGVTGAGLCVFVQTHSSLPSRVGEHPPGRRVFVGDQTTARRQARLDAGPGLVGGHVDVQVESAASGPRRVHRLEPQPGRVPPGPAARGRRWASGVARSPARRPERAHGGSVRGVQRDLHPLRDGCATAPTRRPAARTRRASSTSSASPARGWARR